MNIDLEVYENVQNVLKKEGCYEYEHAFNDALKKLKSDDGEKICQGAHEIIEMCHARILGDLNVTTMPWKDWLILLTKVRKKSSRIIKSAEKKRL